MAQDYGLLSDPWLNMGIGLLARSINQPRPVNTGEALLGGLGQYSKAIEMQRQAKKDAMVEEAQKQQAMMQAMQIKQMQDQMAREQAKQKWFEGMPSFIKSPSQQALAGGGGPTVDNAAKLPGLTPQLDQMAMIEYLSRSPDPATRIAALKDAAALQNPKRDVQVVGKSLVDLKTGKPIFTDPTPDPLSGDAELYAQAVKQGYKGSIMDFVMAKAAAGRAPQQPTPSQLVQTADGYVWADPRSRTTVPATGPTGAPLKPKLKELPAGISKAILENSTAMQKIDNALAQVEANPDAFGLKNYMPDVYTQRADPGGVDARAKVADIGSLKLHDRSGAAITASEFPRLRPFIPSVTDDAKTVKTKLENLRFEYANMVADMQNSFGEDQGYAPIKLKTADQKGATNPPMKGQVVDGYRFKGGNPADPTSWEKK